MDSGSDDFLTSKNYFMNRQMSTCVKCLLLALVLIISRTSTAQITLSLTIKPPYSSYLSDYRHLENHAVIMLVNTSAASMQVKLVGSLVNESNGLSIQTNNDYRPLLPITIAPHGTTTVSANAGAMTFLDESNAVTNASDNVKQEIERSGMLPEGAYRLCIDVLDYNTGALIGTSGQGCATFNITQAQPPAITYPRDGQTIPAEQKAINFSWTPPIGNLAGMSVRYKLVVAEVIPGQNPNDAIAVARDYKANNPALYKANLVSQVYVTQPSDISFTAGHTYAVQVVANDVSNKQVILNNGQSAIVTFTYGSIKSNNTGKGKEKSACDQLLAKLKADKKLADAAFKKAAQKRADLYNAISGNKETLNSAKAKKVLSEYAIAKTNKHIADSMLYYQQNACNELVWQMNDRKENPAPAYCDLEKDLRDSLKRIGEEIEKKKKEIDSLGISVAKGEKATRDCEDSLKKADSAAKAAGAELEKAARNKKIADDNAAKGRSFDGAAGIEKKYKDAEAKKTAADKKVKEIKDRCDRLGTTVAEERKKKDVTLPGEVKKLEGDSRHTDSLIDDCKKKKAEEEERWKRHREETERIEKEREETKRAEAETAKFNNHILTNIYNYECICSKEYWDSKGIWDWLPDAINKPVSDALEDKVGVPVPLDALNALLGLYQIVEKIKDPCSPAGCKRIGDAVRRSGEINPKTGQPWDGTEKCEAMCEMLKKINALKK